MHIFVYEHVAGGGYAGSPLVPSLAREGQAMLEAIAFDLARVPGVSVVTTLDARIEPRRFPEPVEVRAISSRDEATACFDALARASDGTLVIAPELDGGLARLARRVIDAGGRHLGSSPEAIESASDKLLLPCRLAEMKIACVPSAARGSLDNAPFGLPAVVKPRFGAGSTDTVLVREPGEWPRVNRESVVTPFTAGLPASVLVIAGPRGILPLRAGQQVLSGDGRLRYLGGRLPLSPRLEARAQRLAVRAVNAVPGLLGFAGVDLLLDVADSVEPRDGQDMVVEVNARLTTSYAGLRALAETNLAEHWLRVIHGEHPAAPTWRPGGVRFHPDGSLELAEAAPC